MTAASIGTHHEISPNRVYRVQEIAAMMGCTGRTVFNWRTLGFKTKRHGLVTLTLRCLHRGSRAWCWGHELLDFLDRAYSSAEEDRDEAASTGAWADYQRK